MSGGGPVLGIDLGTTNAVVAVADGGQARVITDPEGQRLVPSVVSFRPDGRIAVGYEARERRLIDAANTVYAVKRLIGRPFDSPEVARARERFAFSIVPNKHGGAVVEVRKGTYALAEISAMVLRELKRVAEEALGVPCERAVVTVPANFNELQRSATQAAGRVAGLEILRILNEPTAAALAYGYGTGQREKVAVYDLGGGTFDITILELEDDVFEVLATAGDTFLGGEDLDDAIAQRMAAACVTAHGWDPRGEPQAYERLKAAGEWTKCQLSDDELVELTIEELGTHRGRAIDLDFDLDRAALEAIARPWLERSFEVCERALDTAGLRADEVDSVVLVGGSTRMPLCRAMVTAYFGKTPRSDIDPDMVVAQGAAIHGYALAGPGMEVPAPRAIRSARTTRAGVPRDPEVPRQPAFAPPEAALPDDAEERPVRATRPPPSVPDLPAPSRPPGPAVQAARVVAVTTPKTTLDLELDELAPPDDDVDDLRALAPDQRSRRADADAFFDLAPDDPFDVPEPGSELESELLPLPQLDVVVDAPFGVDAPPPPKAPPPVPLDALPGGRKHIPSREPTTPFVIEKHAPPAPSRGGRAAPAQTKAGTGAASAARPSTGADDRSRGRVPAKLDWDMPIELAPAPPIVEEARPAPVLPMPAAPPPLLMDVTPHSLGIETAGGFCRRLIAKNAPLPTEQTRQFTTAQDEQPEVVIRICQGEEDSFGDNQLLGEVVLDQLPPRPRGALAIDVAFILDANGTLAVEARDQESGRARHIRIDLLGGLPDQEIAAMRARLDREQAR